MKLLLCVAVFIFFAAVTNAAVGIGDFSDPKHPGKCVYEGQVIAAGESARTKQCGEFSCGDNGSGRIVTCSTVAAPPKCTLGDYVDESKPYPECCKKHVVCEKK